MTARPAARCADDPLPFVTMLARSVGPGARHLMQLRRAGRRAGTDSSIDAPQPGHTLGDYCAAKGGWAP